MSEEKAGDAQFKVVDRRTFSEEGERRAEAEKDATTQAPATDTGRDESASTPDVTDAGDLFSDEQTGFDTLISYLGTTAMFQMGLLTGPRGERIPADLANARRTIDLLAVLQEKTQGNLSGAEAKMLDDTLYELRLTFVAVNENTRKTK